MFLVGLDVLSWIVTLDSGCIWDFFCEVGEIFGGCCTFDGWHFVGQAPLSQSYLSFILVCHIFSPSPCECLLPPSPPSYSATP